MELQLGLLADSAHADATGKLYILGEFRYIVAQGVPAVHPRLAVVLRIAADAPEVRDRQPTIQFEIVDADGRPVSPRSPAIAVAFTPIGPAERGRVQAQVILELNALPLPAFGDYSIQVIVDGRHVGRVPYHVLHGQLQGRMPPASP